MSKITILALRRNTNKKVPRIYPLAIAQTRILSLSLCFCSSGSLCSLPSLIYLGEVSCTLHLSLEYHLFCKSFLSLCLCNHQLCVCVHAGMFPELHAFMSFTFNFADTETPLCAKHSPGTDLKWRVKYHLCPSTKFKAN